MDPEVTSNLQLPKKTFREGGHLFKATQDPTLPFPKSNRVEANTLEASSMVSLKVADATVDCVITTGSMITCISVRKWKRHLPKLSEWRLKVATGRMTALYDPEEVVFEINKDTVRLPVFIADITDDCLTGIDFLRTYKGGRIGEVSPT